MGHMAVPNSWNATTATWKISGRKSMFGSSMNPEHRKQNFCVCPTKFGNHNILTNKRQECCRVFLVIRIAERSLLNGEIAFTKREAEKTQFIQKYTQGLKWYLDSVFD